MAALVATAFVIGCSGFSPGPSRHLLVVLDGLRPDYITPEIMPTVYALGQQGVTFEHHHSVYPTVTRVNASSISTGAYPERHGLLGNSVFFPDVDPSRFLDTSVRDNLLKINEAVGGRLLTAQTLGDTLQVAGERLLVVSAGSTGSSFLLNHTLAGGAILHSEYTLPESLDARVQAVLGPAPASGSASDLLNQRAVEAFLRVGIPEVDPSVTLLWLTDPDTTAHEHGIGNAVTIESLRAVDRQIRRLEDGLKEAGLFERYNIWVTSDHGFSTHTGAPELRPIFDAFAGELPDGSPRIVLGNGAIYVRDGSRDVVRHVVETLQQTPGVGAIFTQSAVPESLDGWVPGTLSFKAVHWRHERSADVLFSPDWTSELNEYGIPGTTSSSGVAGHGSSSPFDIRIPLIASGPDLKHGTVIGTPSANLDFAPTFLHLLGIDPPSSMQGRVLSEALVGGPDPSSVPTSVAEHRVASPGGTYQLTGYFSLVEIDGGSYCYLDKTNVTRGRQHGNRTTDRRLGGGRRRSVQEPRAAGGRR